MRSSQAGSPPPAARRITIAQANALGRRLRRNGVVGEDRGLLEDLLADSFGVLLEVQTDLRAALPEVAFTPRLKTVDTIVDKLRREPSMALSRMRDVAGIRIVEDMDRDQQDVLARQVREAIGVCKVVDRRIKPSFGYRAVHLEHDRGGIHVEVQVRTEMQDQWAQIVERLADSWGRQVRYGGGPADPDRQILPDWTRAKLWDLVRGLADDIDAVELFVASYSSEGDEADPENLAPETAKRDLAQSLKQIYDIVRPDWV